MAPKAKREKSRDKLQQVSTPSASQLGEESLSAPNSQFFPDGSLGESAPFSSTGQSRLGEESEPASPVSPHSPTSPGSMSDSSPSDKKGRKGKRKNKKAKDEEEEAPIDEGPRYQGPPPDEEFLDDVLHQVGTKMKWRESDWLESLHLTLREGEVGIGQEVNTRNKHGFTPLAVASAAGDAALVALLLEHGADAAMASTGRAELPLHHAASYSNVVVAQLLVAPCQKLGIIDARTSTGWTPLHTCAHSGDREVFRILMKAKADLETRNPITGDEHALHVAARASNLDIIEILLAADADVNCADSMSRTPLHLAAAMSHADCVSLLLRSHADPLHRGGPGHNMPIEIVPAEVQQTAEETVQRPNELKAEWEARLQKDVDAIAERKKVLRLLTSYGRPPPSPPRVDIRFDQRDSKALI